MIDVLTTLLDPSDPLLQGLDRCERRFILLGDRFPTLPDLVARMISADAGVATWIARRPPDARVSEKTVCVQETWQDTYCMEKERLDT